MTAPSFTGATTNHAFEVVALGSFGDFFVQRRNKCLIHALFVVRAEILGTIVEALDGDRISVLAVHPKQDYDGNNTKR